MFKSILRVLKSVREYKIFAIITPLFMIGEAAVECFLPYIMSEFVGKIESNNNTVTAKATGGNTAYGIYVYAAKAATASGPLAGDHAIAGEATINGGKYTATASGTTAYAACVADPVLQGEATATPTLIINGGKFKGTAGATPFADVSLAGEPAG